MDKYKDVRIDLSYDTGCTIKLLLVSSFENEALEFCCLKCTTIIAATTATTKATAATILVCGLHFLKLVCNSIHTCKFVCNDIHVHVLQVVLSLEAPDFEQ